MSLILREGYLIDEEAVYQPLVIEQEIDTLLAEFDTKLDKCLEKIREKCTPEQKECIALYKAQAIQLRDAVTQTDWFGNEDFLTKEILGCAIKSFDALLEGRQDDQNNKQLLILARDLGNQAKNQKIDAAACGFIAATALVCACVFAIPTVGISLLFLISVVHSGVAAALQTDNSLKSSDKQEKLSSFTETGKGFFSDAAEGKPSQDEAQQARAPWYRRFGGGGK